MKRILLIILLITNFQLINAQYTEIINSKSPGFSESPYGVGTNVLQLESGFFFGKNNSNETFAKTDPYGATFFLRYGKFMERLEFNAKVTYQKDKVVFNNIFTTPISETSGISELTFGLKYLLFQQKFADKSKEIKSWKKRTSFDKKRLIPSVGMYLGLNTNFLGNAYKDTGKSLKAAILLQNDFTDRFVLISNLVADKIGKNNQVYSYIVTATYAINGEWSFFVENEGDFLNTQTNYHLGTGTAYLWSENIQFDASVRIHLNSNQSNYIAGVGVSWRLDKHRNKKIRMNKNGKRKKKGIFSKLFKKKK